MIETTSSAREILPGKTRCSILLIPSDFPATIQRRIASAHATFGRLPILFFPWQSLSKNLAERQSQIPSGFCVAPNEPLMQEGMGTMWWLWCPRWGIPRMS